MEHSDPFENEKLLSNEDHLKLLKIGKWMISVMVSMFVSLLGVVIYS